MTKDSLPNPHPPSGEELSPRLRLYKKFDEAYDRFVEEMRNDEKAIEEMRTVERLDDFEKWTQEKVLDIWIENPEGTEINFRGNGADALALNRTKSGLYVLTIAATDRLGEDYLNGPATVLYPSKKDTSDYAHIVAGTEIPPFVCSADIHHNGIDAYLAELRGNGEEPDFLSDEESIAVQKLMDASVGDAFTTVTTADLDMWKD